VGRVLPRPRQPEWGPHAAPQGVHFQSWTVAITPSLSAIHHLFPIWSHLQAPKAPMATYGCLWTQCATYELIFRKKKVIGTWPKSFIFSRLWRLKSQGVYRCLFPCINSLALYNPCRPVIFSFSCDDSQLISKMVWFTFALPFLLKR
jgi:hypothetical protein